MQHITRRNVVPRSDFPPAARKRHSWRPALAAVAVFGGMLTFGSCGGDDLLIGTNIPPTLIPLTPTPECFPNGRSCTRSQDCCSGVCFTTTKTCQ